LRIPAVEEIPIHVNPGYHDFQSGDETHIMELTAYLVAENRRAFVQAASHILPNEQREIILRMSERTLQRDFDELARAVHLSLSSSPIALNGSEDELELRLVCDELLCLTAEQEIIAAEQAWTAMSLKGGEGILAQEAFSLAQDFVTTAGPTISLRVIDNDVADAGFDLQLKAGKELTGAIEDPQTGMNVPVWNQRMELKAFGYDEPPVPGMPLLCERRANDLLRALGKIGLVDAKDIEHAAWLEHVL